MAQQTAVDIFYEQIDDIIPDALRERIILFKEQAKEMEMEQMRKCASFWRGKENEIEKPIFEQYYNQTYKKNLTWNK